MLTDKLLKELTIIFVKHLKISLSKYTAFICVIRSKLFCDIIFDNETPFLQINKILNTNKQTILQFYFYSNLTSANLS